VVVDARRREVDGGIEKLADQRADGVGPRERGELVTELEVLEDILDVGREAVEVVLEIREELLLAPSRPEVTQGELRGVVERLTSGIAQGGALLGDVRLVEHLPGGEHPRLGRLEDGIHAPDDEHRQDHVRVLAALEEVAQDVIGDAPDEGDDLVVRCLIHYLVRSISAFSISRAATTPPSSQPDRTSTRPQGFASAPGTLTKPERFPVISLH
jgi:hypothetical protein